jgi:uncharacterized protein YrrD
MLQLSDSFINTPVLSLRTGGPVGTTVSPIINPNNLKIEGFYCMDRFSKNRLVLLAQEIRDIVPDGIVVNDHEAMSEPDELVRLKEIIALQFELLGKPVITNNRKRLGKVNDYAIDTASLYIQKLYVSQSIMKSLSGGQISIGRSQILEITHKKIVVQEPTVSAQEVIPASRPATA